MNRLRILLLLCAAAFALPVRAPARMQENPQARDLFSSYAATNAAKGRPGAKLRLELLRAERRQFVPFDTVFRAGDKVKLHFEVNFATQVAIYNLGTSGKVSRLYPQRGQAAAARAGIGYIVPAAATKWFEFDHTPGTEKLNFLFSSVSAHAKSVHPASKTASTDVVVVEPGGRGLAEESSPEANEAALANGRDLNRVQLKDGYYVLGDVQQLRQRVGIQLSLQHR
jgi:hypothetical protein